MSNITVLFRMKWTSSELFVAPNSCYCYNYFNGWESEIDQQGVLSESVLKCRYLWLFVTSKKNIS